MQVAALAEAAGDKVDDNKPYAELWCAAHETPRTLPPTCCSIAVRLPI